jgi:hypothetical protein
MKPIMPHHRTPAEKPHHSGQSALVKACSKILMCKHTHRAGMCTDSSKTCPSCCAVTRVCCARNTKHMNKYAHHRHRTTCSQSSLLSACRYSCASFCQWTHRAGMWLSHAPVESWSYWRPKVKRKCYPVLRARVSRRVPVSVVVRGRGVWSRSRRYSQHSEQAVQGHDCASLHALSL